MKIVVIGGSGLIGSKLVTSSRARPRGGRGVARHGRQHAHRRGSRRGPRGRLGGRRRVELALVRGRGGAGVLRDLDPQPPRRRGGRRRGAPRRAVGRGHRAPARERLLPREGRAGEADQGLLDPVLDRPRDAVLRVHRRASPRTPPTATRSACRPRSSSPIAADDVAARGGRIAVGPPVNGIVEVAGPDAFRLDELIRARLDARPAIPRAGDHRPDARLLRRHARASGPSSPATTRTSRDAASKTGSRQANARRVRHS